MKKQVILAMVAGVLAMGCKQSEIQTTNQPQQGEPIEVALTLPLDQSQAVGRAEAQTSSWNEGAIGVELATAPIDNHQSKAVADATVANVWVLQFNGTATNSALIYKNYIPAYTAGSTVQLLRAAATNRVAIVANTFDATWANAFALNSATWATVSAATKAVAAQSDVLRPSGGTDYLPMSGSNTGTLAVGGTLNIPLTRTVVQVVVNLKSGADLKATAMNVQMGGVPRATSWFPDTGTGVWPASPSVTNEYAAENVTGITTTGFVSRTFWVPVNRRGTVTGTTGLTRYTNAPTNATYLDVSTNAWAYKVHLGANFTTDYNLQANTKYTYSLTFQTDPAATDSRVVDRRKVRGYVTQGVSVDGIGVPAGMMYVGLYGGHNGSTYTKGLYMDKRGSSLSGVNSGSESDIERIWGDAWGYVEAESRYTGKANSDLMRRELNDAAYYCMSKMMFVPAMDQLNAMWTAIIEARNDAYIFTSVATFSSTETSSGGQAHAIGHSGEENRIAKATRAGVRCVQEF